MRERERLTKLWNKVNLRNVIPCCSTALESFKIYSANHGFCEICLAMGGTIAVVDHCCGCTSNKQSKTKPGTVVTGWFGSHWTVECSFYVFWLAVAQFMSVFISWFLYLKSVSHGILHIVFFCNLILWALMLENGTNFIFLNEAFLYIYTIHLCLTN